jgi:hypothetical protein
MVLLKINCSKFTRGLEPLYGDARSAKSFEVLTLIFSTDCSPIDWLQSVTRFENIFLFSFVPLKLALVGLLMADMQSRVRWCAPLTFTSGIGFAARSDKRSLTAHVSVLDKAERFALRTRSAPNRRGSSIAPDRRRHFRTDGT